MITNNKKDFAAIQNLTVIDLPDVDMDGNVRIYGGRIDIGAYEYGATPVGIENATAQQSLSIFPNPSHDGVFQLKTEDDNLHWTVFDITGKTVLQGHTPQIDLRAHEKGGYVIKVSTEKGDYRARLIKF